MSDTSTTPIVSLPTSEVSTVEAFLRGLPSDPTRQVYRRAIAQLAAFLGGRDVCQATRRDVEAFRGHLEAAGRSPSTIAKTMSALAGLYTFAVAEGTLSVNPTAAARRPKVSDRSPRQGLSAAEVRALLAVPDRETLVGLRDLALVTVLALQGWRISEALGLHVEQLGEEQGQRVATITGKGGKVARVPLASATWLALTSWTAAASISSGPILVGVLKGGRVQLGEPMSAQAAWKRLRHLAHRAGIARAIHPHLFRHGAVTQALAAGVPLHEVQDFARHADPRTTRRYDSHRQSLANRTPHVLAAVIAPGEA